MLNFTRKPRYDYNDLLEIVRLLRSAEGCPWDRVQTHQSIRRGLLEEAYEAAEAIDTEDTALLREELGDVLMQVVFHADIERQRGRFTMEDVVDGVVKKLIFRHPHVFGGAEPDKLNEFLSSISRLPGIRVDGLMCIPPAVDGENVRRYFAMMRELFEKAKGYDMPNVFMNTLSMGMSGDYRAAVAEGATMVRVGHALFGERMRPGPKA